MGLFKFWFLHLKHKKMIKKKTYMINYILIKQAWLEENIILIKRCTKLGESKNVKEPNEKKSFL
jgi:hypothetical protein